MDEWTTQVKMLLQDPFAKRFDSRRNRAVYTSEALFRLHPPPPQATTVRQSMAVASCPPPLHVAPSFGSPLLPTQSMRAHRKQQHREATVLSGRYGTSSYDSHQLGTNKNINQSLHSSPVPASIHSGHFTLSYPTPTTLQLLAYQ
jgi:hypothetical protein